MISCNQYWRVILLGGLVLTGCRKSGPPYSVADALKHYDQYEWYDNHRIDMNMWYVRWRV